MYIYRVDTAMVHVGCHLQDQREAVFLRFSCSPVAISAAQLSEIEITWNS
jgi:hypothetical protein